MRGLPICATSCGRIVTVWFGSPTKGADSSDSFQFSMPCVDEFHASDLVEAYGVMIQAHEMFQSNSMVENPRVIDELQAELGRQAGIIADLMVKNNSLTETLTRHYGATV